MLSLKATARTHSLDAHSPPQLRRKPVNARSPFSVRMYSSANPSQIIEHIVLFKAKPDAATSAVTAMLTNLNSLTSLDSVLHISAGPIFRCRSDSLTFTHMLHSRHRSKPDLVSYSDDPIHVRVVSNYVRPVVDDIMAVDWVAEDLSGSPVVSPGSAMRLTILKVKEGAGEVLGVVRGIKDKFTSIEQSSGGENFSPGRAKGFSIRSIAVFKGIKELETLESELVINDKDKAGEFLDDVLVLDYVAGV